MKNLKIISAIVALAFLSLSFTSTTETKEELHQQIVKLIGDSSESLSKVNLEVNVTFTLNNKSEIVVISINSDNDVVDQFVKSKLNYKKVSVKDLNPGELYHIPLVIKSE